MNEITATVSVSNPDETTPNFTAAMEDLGAFLADVWNQMKPATYAFVYDAEAEAFLLNGAEHAPVGIAITITDPEEEPYADGDTITVAVEASEVEVTNPRNRPAGSYHDAVVDGVVYRGIPDKTIYIEDADDLDSLTNEQPGTLAELYDGTAQYRWDGADWTAIGGE